MKSKKGFTLVELLAVIAILAILVVIALPNVIDMFQGAKKGTFKTEIQTIMKQAQSTWVLGNGVDATYTNCMNNSSTAGQNNLSLQGTELNYVIKINTAGEFTEVSVSNQDYAFSNDVEGFVASDVTDDQIYASSDDPATNYVAADEAAKANDGTNACD